MLTLKICVYECKKITSMRIHFNYCVYGFLSTWFVPQWCVWKGGQENTGRSKRHNVRWYWQISSTHGVLSTSKSPRVVKAMFLCSGLLRGPPDLSMPPQVLVNPWGCCLSTFKWGLGICVLISPRWFFPDKPEKHRYQVWEEMHWGRRLPMWFMQ